MTFTKVLSAGDRNDRLSIPAIWRDQLFPEVANNGRVRVRVSDDKGDWYEFVMKVRKNRTKPEFMAKGWKRFVRKRKLFPGDIVAFTKGETPGTCSVRVEEVGPKLELAIAPPPETVEEVGPMLELAVAPPPETVEGPLEEASEGGACFRLFGRVIRAFHA